MPYIDTLIALLTILVLLNYLVVVFSKSLLNDQYDLKNEVLNNSSTGLNFVKISLNIASDSNLNTITPFMI